MPNSKSYEVTMPLKHDGERYGPGDSIELEPKHAKALLAASAIREPGEATETPPADGEGAKATETPPAKVVPIGAERIAAIKDAIGKLDKGNAEHWNNDGVTPGVKALEGVLGYDITAGERDQAMQELGSKGAES